MAGFYAVGPSDRVIYGISLVSAPPLDDDILLGLDMFNLLHPTIEVGEEFFNSLVIDGATVAPSCQVPYDAAWLVWDREQYCWRVWGSA